MIIKINQLSIRTSSLLLVKLRQTEKFSSKPLLSKVYRNNVVMYNTRRSVPKEVMKVSNSPQPLDLINSKLLLPVILMVSKPKNILIWEPPLFPILSQIMSIILQSENPEESPGSFYNSQTPDLYLQAMTRTSIIQILSKKLPSEK